jgi:DNA-binding winged helix-turn-helix (wHTH) protein
VAISFGPFVLDQNTRQLLRDDRVIHVSPKAFDLLATLANERPKAVTKAELQRRLWPKTFVNEANLSNLVSEIRAALDDDRQKSRYIRTVHGYGYAFCPVAAATTESIAGDGVGTQCQLESNGRWFSLPAGEHVVGRGATVAIRLHHPTVSRRHARLVVTPHRTILEDCESKNGTFHDDARVTAPVELGDGDLIRFGSVMATFHASAALATTATAT